MKILAPLNSPDEVEMLLANGAEELYCGLVPQDWVERYTGAIWLNRRSPLGGNLRSFADLARVVEQAHAGGVPVYVTLNAQNYAAEQLPLVLELAQRYVGEAGVDGLIVSDPALIVALGEEKLPCSLHLSSVAACLNTSAIRFFVSMGIRRVILPRSLTLAEIERIAEAVAGEVELEVFILNDGCIFEEGNCLTTHHHSVGAFCTGLARMQSRSLKLSGTEWKPGEEQRIAALRSEFQERIGVLTNACSMQSQTAQPVGPCGLCAIPFFQRLGIAAIKIVGREASALRKLLSLKQVRAVVERVRQGATEEAVQACARTIRGRGSPCIPGSACYYQLPVSLAEGRSC